MYIMCNSNANCIPFTLQLLLYTRATRPWISAYIIYRLMKNMNSILTRYITIHFHFDNRYQLATSFSERTYNLIIQHASNSYQLARWQKTLKKAFCIVAMPGGQIYIATVYNVTVMINYTSFALARQQLYYQVCSSMALLLFIVTQLQLLR